jgi:SAM-dependent methyltransferase
MVTAQATHAAYRQRGIEFTAANAGDCIMTDPSEEIVGLYQRRAGAWMAKRAGGPEQPMESAWLDCFLSLTAPRPSVLDIGCGSGSPIGAYLSKRDCLMTGVDSSPQMIDACRRAFPLHCWKIADMRSLALGATFDGLLAWDSFFHLSHENQRRMFPVF